jgi:hypothetical protein
VVTRLESPWAANETFAVCSIPVFVFPVDGGVIGTATPTLEVRWTRTGNAVLRFFVDNSYVGDGTFDSASNSWKLSLTQALTAGGHTILANGGCPGNPDGDNTPINVAVDLTDPDTVIVRGPSSPHGADTASFTFRSAGETRPVRFRCKLNEQAYADCGSGAAGDDVMYTVSGLTNGDYIFYVYAIDAAGRVDATPATHSFTVDLLPETTLTGVPPNPSNSATATFRFSSNKPGSSFECSLDSAEYAPCASPVTTPVLSQGSHTFSVRAIDTAGNVDPTPASHTWSVDTIPPDTTLTGTPPNPSNSTTATFRFSSNEPGSSFECSLDSAEYAPCASPVTTPVLSQGSHTFSVRAIDTAGNVDPTPASFTWSVDLVAPDTILTGMPPNPSNNPSATFTFSSDEAGSSFECSLDSPVYTPCSGPLTTPPLRDGSHTFSVRAKDPAGNVDPTPPSYSWGVDTVAPDTTFTSTPSNPSNSDVGIFTFSSNEPGSSFECRLDSAPYEPCTSPVTTPVLSQGNHTFSVRARDAAGNVDLTPAVYAWVVDTVAPDTTITGMPPNPSNRSIGAFSFSSNEPGSSFECGLDSGDYVVCSSPWNTPFLRDGSHTLWVRAKDAAGNVDPTPAVYFWEVDTIPPDAVIDEASKPLNPTNVTEVTFRFSGAGAGGHYWCRLDSQQSQPVACDSGSATYTGLTNRVHTFTVYAVDAAGNDDSQTPATYSWQVDTIPPHTTIEEVSPASSPTNSTRITFRFTGAGPGGRYSCDLDSLGYQPCDSGSVTYTGLSHRRHTFSVYATDAAGNVEDLPVEYPWIVDLDPPETLINAALEEGGGELRTPTNSPRVTFRFSGADTGGSYFCKLDSGVFTPCPSGEQQYTVGEGIHTFSVYAVDSAGNSDLSPAAHVWRVDLTPPEPTLTNPKTNTTTNIWRTNQQMPTFRGTSEPQSRVQLSIDDVVLQEQATAGTDRNWELAAAQPLSEGTHRVSIIRVEDAARNQWVLPPGAPPPASYSFEFIVDLTPPETEIRSKPARNHNSVVVPFTLYAPGEPLELNTTFECKLVSQRYDKEIVGPCSRDKSYDLELDFEISDVNGTYTFSVAARDEAGNMDPTPAVYEFDVLVKPPDPPEIFSPGDGEDVYNLTPTISGKAVSQGTVLIYLDGVKAGPADADEKEGLFNFTFSEPLEETTHVLTARVTDLANNRSGLSGPVSFTVFEPKPVAHAIGGGLGCATSGVEPWLALAGLVAGTVLSSRRRRR